MGQDRQMPEILVKFILLLTLLCSALGCHRCENNGDLAPADGPVAYVPMDLIKAAEMGDLEQVRIAIAHGSDVNARDDIGRTPLMWAAIADANDVVKLLIEHGAEVEARTNTCSITAFTEASWPGHWDVVKTLVKHGADVNQTCYECLPALVSAVTENNHEVARFLLEHGADPNRGDSYHNFTSVHAMKDLEMARLLFSHGADPDGHYDHDDLVMNSKGSPLHQAASPAIVKFLLDQGADPNLTDGSNRTPLHVAAKHGQEEICKLLIERGVGVNGRDDRGRTPLHHAVFCGQENISKLLLAHGADPTVKDMWNQTPMGEDFDGYCP